MSKLISLKEIFPSLVPAHEILQDGALPCALATDHGYLRQIQIAALADGAESIVEAVDQRDELLHAPVSHANRGGHR